VNNTDTITVDLSKFEDDSDNTVTISSFGTSGSNTVIGGGFTYPNTISATGGPFTISGGAGNTGPYTYNPWDPTSSSKIKLNGKDADIEINGESLVGMIRRIEQRLNILTPNPELETEWEELRALGEQYRVLEQYIKDKQATWDKLTAMAPLVID